MTNVNKVGTFCIEDVSFEYYNRKNKAIKVSGYISDDGGYDNNLYQAEFDEDGAIEVSFLIFLSCHDGKWIYSPRGQKKIGFDLRDYISDFENQNYMVVTFVENNRGNITCESIELPE